MGPRVTGVASTHTARATAPSARVRVTYFAAARAAARRESDDLEVFPTDTLADVVARLGTAEPELARVLARCSFLRDSVVVRDRNAPLLPCSAVDVLPPFAGG